MYIIRAATIVGGPFINACVHTRHDAAKCYIVCSLLFCKFISSRSRRAMNIHLRATTRERVRQRGSKSEVVDASATSGDLERDDVVFILYGHAGVYRLIFLLNF